MHSKFYIMKVILILAFLLMYSQITTARSVDNSLSGCKCWTNYAPRKIGRRVQCHCIMCGATVPCNIPEAPDCACRGSRVSGVITDKNGKWCFSSGDDSRWPCENVAQWRKYEKECKERRLYCIPNSNSEKK